MPNGLPTPPTHIDAIYEYVRLFINQKSYFLTEIPTQSIKITSWWPFPRGKKRNTSKNTLSDTCFEKNPTHVYAGLNRFVINSHSLPFNPYIRVNFIVSSYKVNICKREICLSRDPFSVGSRNTDVAPSRRHSVRIIW